MIKSKLKILCTLVVLIGGLHAEAQELKYVIEGKFKNWTSSQKVFISYLYNNEEIVDSTQSKDGKFLFAGVLPEPVAVSIYRNAPDRHSIRDNRGVYVGKGTTQLLAEDSLKYAAIKGTQLAVDYDKFERSMKPYFRRLGELRMTAFKLDKVKDKVAIEKLQIENDSIFENIVAIENAFLAKNKGSHSSLMIIKRKAGSNFDQQDLYNKLQSLDKVLLASPLAKELSSAFEIGIKLGLGKPLPNFSAPDTTGNVVSLDQVRKLGKVTLVDFWASWCGPCRAENPSLRKLYADYHDQGLNIIAISLDRSEKAWKQAIVQDVLPWYHISNLKFWDEPIALAFQVSSVPDSFLLDAEGKIIARGVRGEKLRELVAKQLSK